MLKSQIPKSGFFSLFLYNLVIIGETVFIDNVMFDSSKVLKLKK